MTAYLLSYGLPCLVAVIAGGLTGGLVVWKCHRPEPATVPLDSKPDSEEFVSAELDLAAVQWAKANNQPPEAAGLMAERLKTLRSIGQRKGWM
jgi:hypothetical protein